MQGKRTALIYFLWWMFCLIVQSGVIYWLGFDLKISLTDGFVSSGILVLCGFVTANFYRYYQPGKKNRLYRLVWGIALTAGCVIAQRYALLWLFEKNQAYGKFMNESMPVRFLFSLLVIAFMTLITWLWAYMKGKQEEELRRANAEGLSKEAELARLQQQLQPHFLFNSLNSVNALIGLNPDEARKMIQKLSDFMRMTLRKNDQLVPFSEELQHLQLYLGIEKVRFGHRLEIIIDADQDCINLLLPPLLLQPVAENAIKFGLYNTTGNVRIKLEARNKNGFLEIKTQNPFDESSQSLHKGTGYGLSSVQRRLYLLFGRNDLLKISSNENIFQTQILIPQVKTNNK